MQSSIKPMVPPRPYPMNYDYHLGGEETGNGYISAARVFGSEELVFEGHFPSNKILPGVMLVEYALYLGERYLESIGDDSELTELKTATFLSPVLPGDRVSCRCDFSPDNDYLLMKAELKRDETICAKVQAKYGRRE